MNVAYSILPLLLGAAVAHAAPLPPAPTEAFVEDRFGHDIDDPYRWMEDPAQAAKLQAWMTEAGAATRARLDVLPERAAFETTLRAATRAGVSYNEAKSAGGRLFFRQRDPGAAVSKLVVRDDAGERVLLDTATREGATQAIASFAPSPDGALVAVMVGEGGGELGRFAILDVADGRERYRLDGMTFGDFELSWLAPDLVAYTRMTHAPDSGVDPLLDTQAMVVALTPQGPVERVGLGNRLEGGPTFAPEEFPAIIGPGHGDLVFGYGLGARADARALVTSLAALRAGTPAWRSLADYSDQLSTDALVGESDYYFVSTREASNGALYRRTLGADAIGAIETVMPAGDLILSDLVATRDGLYVMGTRDGVSQVLYLAGGKGAPQAIALPFESELQDAAADGDGGSMVFGLRGWTTTTRAFRATGARIEALGLDSATWAPTQAFVATRAEALSRDGTRVPMVVVRKPGAADAPVPTFVEGYGSYGVLTTSPLSSPLLSPWIERDGAFVFCGTRGGGERGRAWHEAGREANKPNAHDDLAACAQQAQTMGIASPATTLVMGTSAGGLLAPATTMKHPELFAGLMPRVAVLNASRLEAAPNGPNQFAEMGDPRTQAGFEALLAQDAYVMLEDARDLPDTLITVGMNDSRVAPWMAAKFAARASAIFGDRREILLRVDTTQGHGIGSSQDSQVAELADAFAWGWAQATTP
ncbi:prolyl oligopeptidase family serine peptidase [Luteimonas fraxinea]|uniref:prolyl oligopeptidase n=1 Tax=Luteimonas fraxinea TaxID=2901869 RepID=A0ABS8UDL3_9GAMM|nr:prolyl oligopeptidase family serine peptidase [Luteimonas fraxinea]MCD9096753.1 prolyl oligopeptidase family serine peptidase [Luteimonas fraxinea]